MKDTFFNAEQYVPSPRNTVFAFFAEPRNLEAITPPWLRFRAVHISVSPLREGAELTYRLRIHGWPMTWKSRIEEWRPNERFVDVQLRGPYGKWHHTHEFADHDHGTLVRDRVCYRLPLGWLGDRIAGRYVASDLRRIFAYRAARTQELLVAAGNPT